MEFKQFTEEIKVNVSGLLGPGREVFLQYNLKNNDQKKCGVVIREKNQAAVLTIYLEPYYDQFCSGETLEQIVDDIILLSATAPVPNINSEEILADFDKCKSKILYRLVGTCNNEKFLLEHPHDRYMDLAKVYYVLLDINDMGCLSMLIRHEHLKLWGITLQELQTYGKVNTCCEMPVKFNKVRNILDDQFKEIGVRMPEYDDFIYLLTNEYNHYGASALLYDGVLEMIYQEIQGDYYILPSSVHELFVIPTTVEVVNLKEIIKGGNKELEDDEDILSHNG